MKIDFTTTLKSSLGLLLAITYMVFSISFCFLPSAKAQKEVTLKELSKPSSAISLFAKTGSGDYYTLYPEGIKKEDSYIGGFKSAQLDPFEENIYFFDTTLKVISKINLKDGKIYKVIGKPKGSLPSDFTNPVKFNDANLGPLTDFTFDRYGNLYLLYSVNKNNALSPRLLKASLKDQTIKEVFVFNNYFLPSTSSDLNFSLNNISYDHDRYFYITGSLTNYGALVLRFDPLINTGDIFAAKSTISGIGFTPKATLSDSQNLTINGLAFDESSTCYLASNDYRDSKWSYYTEKLVQENNEITNLPFIGDGTGSASDIGDGGAAKSAFAGLFGTRCLCGDKNGDMFIADSATNRIRKIIKDSGLITTVAGGGSESIKFGETKSMKDISLLSPNTILVDKSNNLYIVENNRILQVTNVITHNDKPLQQVKVANLAITKIAGNEVENPKGDISLPDLSLDYTYTGDQTIEVKGENIPNGTNVKLLTTNTDGSVSPTIPSAKLISGIASVPVKIEAGTAKVIKAETDPFIPAPGVYLSGTEPKIDAGQLPPEPNIPTPNRDSVNATGNLLSSLLRFNFNQGAGWQRSDNWWASTTKSNAAIDPDNASSDATFLSLESYGPNVNSTTSFDTMKSTGKNVKFSVWMRTDSGNVTIPIGIAPSAATSQALNIQYYASWIANNYPQYTPLFLYTNVNVTPTWQKFSVSSDSTITSYPKQIYIGGLGNTKLQKIYIWGARLEELP